jgi:hypothetical protein
VDFGYPARLNGIYGVYLPFDQTGTFSNTSVVASALTEFARGYWVGTGSNTAAKLHIAVGTNNCCVGVALSVFQGHGTAWAQMMNSISATVDSYASQVTVVAASDMELEFNGPYTTTQWIANFMNARQCTPSVDEQGCLYNFGNQTAAVPTTSQGPCNYTNTITTTWKACDVWYVSWGQSVVAIHIHISGPYRKSTMRLIHLLILTELMQQLGLRSANTHMTSGSPYRPVGGFTSLDHSRNLRVAVPFVTMEAGITTIIVRTRVGMRYQER